MNAPIIQNITPIIQNITPIVQHYATGNARAVMFGGGLAYAISNGYWHHTPLILLNPFAYASYQVFVSRLDVLKWCKQTYKEFL
jgi:hypothetical protein